MAASLTEIRNAAIADLASRENPAYFLGNDVKQGFCAACAGNVLGGETPEKFLRTVIRADWIERRERVNACRRYGLAVAEYVALAIRARQKRLKIA